MKPKPHVPSLHAPRKPDIELVGVSARATARASARRTHRIRTTRHRIIRACWCEGTPPTQPHVLPPTKPVTRSLPDHVLLCEVTCTAVGRVVMYKLQWLVYTG